MKLKAAISTGDSVFKQATQNSSGGVSKSNQTLSTAYSAGTNSSGAQKGKFGTL
jgi:hypothetical protein